MLAGKKNVLVTGGTGFLGSRIVQHLVHKNYKILLLKRKTSDFSSLHKVLDNISMYNIDCGKDEVSRVFQENQIHAILHCATSYGRGSETICQVLETNLIFPLFLLEQAKNFNVQIFINTDTVLDRKISLYAHSKKTFTEWFKEFSNHLTCVNVVLDHFYGFGDDSSKFVTKLIHQSLRRVEAISLTPGEQKRDFIHIEDVVLAFDRVIESALAMKAGFTQFEVGSCKPVKIRDFVELVKKMTHNTVTRFEFGGLPYRDHEIMESKLDASLLSQLGWRPRVSLEEGLRKTIESERLSLKL